MQHSSQLTRLLRVSADIARGLDFATTASRIAEGVTTVTDFRVATVTLRQGDICRRLAASGTTDDRIGLETEYAVWERMMRPDFLRGGISYLIPPGAHVASWVQMPEFPLADAGEDGWTEEHGLILPLRNPDDEIVGFLSVDAPASGLLPSDETIELLELFAHQAETALVNAHLYEEAQRQRRSAETLREVVEAVSSSLDLIKVLTDCCDIVAAHSVGDRASIFLYDPGTQAFSPVMSRGISDPDLWDRFCELPEAAMTQLPSYRQAIETGEPVIIPDVAKAAIHEGEAQLFEAFAIRSVTVYPLFGGGDVVGVLVVDTFRRQVLFPADEVYLMRQIARQAGIAIHQARLHAMVREHGFRNAELHELTKAMTETFDFAMVFERLSRAVRGRVGSVEVLLLEIQGGHLHLVHSDAEDLRKLDPILDRVPLDDSADGIAASLRRDGTLIIGNVEETAELRSIALPRTRSLLLAGHVDDGELSLVLAAASRYRHAFDAGDAAFLSELVEVAALALRNAQLYEDTRRAAERDSLTGLRNRRMFWAELNCHMTAASRGRPTALAVIDLDDFKKINDRHGHTTGDRALVHVADRLMRSVRETDTVYRIGGEEFAVVMPETSGADAVEVLKRVAGAVRRTREPLPAISLSVGIALAPRHGGTAEDLFRAADDALYAVKNDGKDAVRVADEVMGSTLG